MGKSGTDVKVDDIDTSVPADNGDVGDVGDRVCSALDLRLDLFGELVISGDCAILDRDVIEWPGGGWMGMLVGDERFEVADDEFRPS